MSGTWLLTGLLIGLAQTALVLFFVVRPIVARHDDVTFGLLSLVRGGKVHTRTVSIDHTIPSATPQPDDGTEAASVVAPSLQSIWREVK